MKRCAFTERCVLGKACWCGISLREMRQAQEREGICHLLDQALHIDGPVRVVSGSEDVLCSCGV